MIRTMVVDDEKIVRKGILSVMPWEKFNMEVVGDFGDARSALDFLAKNRVDLVLTDLVMPGLSGIELMKEVRRLYPETMVAVLTCHQDFCYIQEALRLGAVDYILKTQLEQEVADHVLDRITSRMQKNPQQEGASAHKGISENALAELSEDIRLRYSDDIIESVLKAVEHMKQHLTVTFSQDIIAKKVNMSRSYFSLCFKDIMGVSFSEYMRRMRMTKARELLENTGKPVYWVAEQTGFQDEKYFSKLFKDETGLLPTEYRNARMKAK